MKLLYEYIRELLAEAAPGFDEWLSPQVVQFLINNYAKQNRTLGRLTWEYGKLGGRTWGMYYPRNRKLRVNKTKTKNLFKQQVETILHEIQHWNQHVACAEEFPEERAATVTAIRSDRNRCQLMTKGYWNAEHEIDARAFAAKHVHEALARAGKFAAGKVETESEEEAWEDILDELSDYDTVTRRDIGQTLLDFDMNTSVNIQRAIQDLKGLGVAVR